MILGTATEQEAQDIEQLPDVARSGSPVTQQPQEVYA